MTQRRYASDYRLEDSVTPKGGIQTRRIYQGVYYRFCQEEDILRRAGKKLCLLSIGCLICLMPILFNNSRIGRTIYVLLPVAFTLLPMYHVAAVGVRLCKYEALLTRQMRDQTDGRLGKASVWLTVLLGLDSIGSGAYWFAKGLERGEGLCVAGIFSALLLSLVVFKMREIAKTEPIEETKPQTSAEK